MSDQERDLAYFLDLVEYPADQRAVLAAAQRHNAPVDVLEELGKLPATTSFASPEEAWAALGG